MNWATPFMTVPNLTRLLDDRTVFPVAISGDELIDLAEAAERLAARARRELLARWVDAQHVSNPPYRLAEGGGHD
jgi:hypothetical protein